MSDRPVDRDAIGERANRFIEACHESAAWAWGSAPEPVKRAYEFARDAAALLDALEAAEQRAAGASSRAETWERDCLAERARVVLLEAQLAEARTILRGDGSDRSDRDVLGKLWRLLLPVEGDAGEVTDRAAAVSVADSGKETEGSLGVAGADDKTSVADSGPAPECSCAPEFGGFDYAGPFVPSECPAHNPHEAGGPEEKKP